MCRRAVKLAPQVALFHANLGEMLRLAGRPKLAAEEARRALEIEPDMPAALSNLGVALYEMKEYEDAAPAHRRAIAAKPDFARGAQQSRQRAACAASASTRRWRPIAARSS